MRMLVVDLEQLLGKPDPAATKTISKPEEDGIGQPGSPDDRGQAYYEADLGRIVTPPPRALLPWLSVWAVAGAILLVSGVAYIGLSWRTAVQNGPPVTTSVHREADLASSPAKPAQGKPVMPPVTTELTQDSTAPSISPSAAVPATANAAALAKPSAAKPAQTKHATNQGTKHVANPRCADLLARVQLGEALSDEAQSVFQKECRQ